MTRSSFSSPFAVTSLFRPAVERGLILDAAQHAHAVDVQLVERELNGLDADDVDEEVRGEVARLRDHPVRQLAHRERLAEVAVDVRDRRRGRGRA